MSSSKNLLSDHDKLVLAAAFLHAQGYRNNQAAEILRANGYSVKEPAFAKLLGEAKERGWVKPIIPRLFSLKVMDEINVMTTVRRKELEESLKALSERKTFKKLSVFYSGQEGTTRQCWDTRLQHFSHLASGHVQEVLRLTDKIGVGWGHTIAALITAIEMYSNGSTKRGNNRQTLFIPTCGEPLAHGSNTRPDRASSALVARLCATWGCANKPLSLAGVSSVIPGIFKGRDRNVVRRYIHEISDYKNIFGPLSNLVPLVDQIQAIITSVGSLTQDWHMYQSELIRTGGISREYLRELAMGDIGGVLLPRKDLSSSKKKEFQSISESWTGIKLKHYEHVANEAIKSNKPGVLVLAIGKNKTEIVLEVVERGLVNELIVDHDLAHSLTEKIFN